MSRRSTRAAYLFAGFIVTSTAFLSGCRQVEETENPFSDTMTALGASSANRSSRSGELSRIQFDDIPVPQGFFLRNHRNESYSFKDDAIRIGRFVYWGRAEVNDVREYYVEEMPKKAYGWRLVEDPGGSDRLTTMTFTKPGHRCEITMEPEHQRPGAGLLVKVWVENTRDNS